MSQLGALDHLTVEAVCLKLFSLCQEQFINDFSVSWEEGILFCCKCVRLKKKMQKTKGIHTRYTTNLGFSVPA